jgi:hypothetical protein
MFHLFVFIVMARDKLLGLCCLGVAFQQQRKAVSVFRLALNSRSNLSIMFYCLRCLRYKILIILRKGVETDRQPTYCVSHKIVGIL